MNTLDRRDWVHFKKLYSVEKFKPLLKSLVFCMHCGHSFYFRLCCR